MEYFWHLNENKVIWSFFIKTMWEWSQLSQKQSRLLLGTLYFELRIPPHRLLAAAAITCSIWICEIELAIFEHTDQKASLSCGCGDGFSGDLIDGMSSRTLDSDVASLRCA